MIFWDSFWLGYMSVLRYFFAGPQAYQDNAIRLIVPSVARVIHKYFVWRFIVVFLRSGIVLSLFVAL